MKIKLDKFDKEGYSDLISWVDSEEALMQFAGPLLKFPLTPQQLDSSLADKKRMAFRVVDDSTNLPIGHAEIYLSDHSAKIGRVLIGNKDQRGKGLGQQMIKLLLDFIFSELNVTIAELNVFDWNIAAIKCYEKIGFTSNPSKRLERKIKNDIWVAINMAVAKVDYEKTKLTKL